MRQVLQTGCLIVGILCLFYFVFIALYAGISERFPIVWIIAGLMFLVLWRMMVYVSRYPDTWLCFVTKVTGLMVIAAAAVILIPGICVAAGMMSKPQNNLDYVIVLGAQVKGTKPSRALRKRLDCAWEYARENPETIMVLSGGQGSDEDISEAQCMQNYLLERGMDRARLILEEKSESTRENLKYSAAFFDREHDSIGILSNNFHICRALALARKEGYQNICGIPASSDPWMQPHYMLREICALLVLVVRGGISL